jgi:hypothetical protein
MGKFILGGLFVVLLALNVAAYVFFVTEIDGSTVVHKREIGPPPAAPDRNHPQR